jgi:hypothetical protein
MVWMTGGQKVHSIRTQLGGLLEILNLSQVAEASVNRIGKVTERFGTIWMVGRVEGESFSVVLDGLLQTLNLSQLLKASENCRGEVIESCGAN